MDAPTSKRHRCVPKLRGLSTISTDRSVHHESYDRWHRPGKERISTSCVNCEAATRLNMQFVPIKNVEQQGVLALHRVRQGFVKARTGLAAKSVRQAG